jgi:hypothetical protein
MRGASLDPFGIVSPRLRGEPHRGSTDWHLRRRQKSREQRTTEDTEIAHWVGFRLGILPLSLSSVVTLVL